MRNLLVIGWSNYIDEFRGSASTLFLNLRYLIKVLKCFFQSHLMSKRIDFRLEVRTRQFLCIVIAKSMQNLLTLLINILLGRSIKDLDILQTQNIAFRL